MDDLIFVTQLYGKEAVSVLNGGLQRWEKLGYPLTTEVPTVKVIHFSKLRFLHINRKEIDTLTCTQDAIK